MCLGQDPPTAETMILAIGSEELESMIEAGNGIVRVVAADGITTGYISVRDGHRETTASLPSWAKPEEVRDAHIPAPGRAVYSKLVDRAAIIRSTQEDLFAGLGLELGMTTVSRYYDSDADSQSLVRLIEVASAMELNEKLRLDRERFASWGFDAMNDLVREYSQFRLSGESLRLALSTLSILWMAGESGVAAIEIAHLAGQKIAGETAVFSIADIDFYCRALDVSTNGYTWRMALGAARGMREYGDDARDEANASLTFEDFHGHLYRALAFYLAAQTLYRIANTNRDSSAPPQLAYEAIKGNHFCEEMRVRILVSFAWAADFTTHGNNFILPDVLEWWLVTRSARNMDVMEHRVLNQYTQLTFPSVIRDLALARVRTFGAETRALGMQQLDSVVSKMRAQQSRLDALDQGVFLQYALAARDQAETWLAEPSLATEYLRVGRAASP